MKKGFVIAIDGPVASGKGTIATALADKIGGVNFNTGAMYRALALKAKREGVSAKDTSQLLSFITTRHISLTYDKRNPTQSIVLLDGENVTEELHTPEMSMGASEVALNSAVPPKMAQLQREIALQTIKGGVPVIMEGRQIGTEVLPDAEVKVFLSANLQTRAKRRVHQYKEQGLNLSLSEVVEQTKTRDFQDTHRKTGALSKDPENHGYFILDNSKMDEKETLSVIIDELKRRDLI